MASKTIKIWPIAENCNEEDIKNALGTSEINRILIKKSAAYVELESQDAVEVLEFTNPHGKFEQLNDAKFQKVDSNFTWDSLSSDSSEIQELKEQRDNFQKGEEHTENLTEPSPQNIFTITNCDLTIISNLNEQSLKKSVFGSFTSIGRVLKKGDKVIFQLQNQYEAEKFQAVFPNLKIPALGNNAAIDLDAENQRNFAEQWIRQHNKQNEIRSAKKQEEQDKTKRVLHEEIIPKLNKLTSMQTDFLNSQQSSGSKVEQGFQDITEHSSENVHTKNQLPENSQSFVLSEERPEREDIMIGDVNYQQERRKAEEQQRRENQRRENQRRENEKRLRQQADRLKQQQQNKRRHQEQENRRKQQQQQTRKRQQEEQARKRQQQQQTRKRQQEEQARKRQQQQQTRKKQQQQQERRKKQEQEDRKRNLEEAKRQLQILEKQQKQAAAQLQRQHQIRQQKQREMLRIKQAVEKQELEKKKLQEQIRIQREREQEERKRKQELQQRKSQIKKVTEQFVLPQNIGQRAQQSIQDFIGKASPERISQFISKDSRTPAYFWGLVMLVVFMLLVI